MIKHQSSASLPELECFALHTFDQVAKSGDVDQLLALLENVKLDLGLVQQFAAESNELPDYRSCLQA